MQRILPVLAVLTALSAIGCGASVHERPKNAERSPLKDPAVLVEHADAYAQAGDYTRAQQYYAAAIAAGAKSKTILPRLLKACIASNDLRLASEYAETELARSPDDAHLRFLTGALHAKVGNSPEARKHLEMAASELPDDAGVQFSVATFFRDDVHDPIKADAYFREYLRIDPKGDHASEARASLMERVQ